DLADRHAAKARIEPGPARHAVDVADDLGARELEELLPRPAHVFLDQTETAEAPPAGIQAAREPPGQHRPLLRQHLARWRAPRQCLARICHLLLLPTGASGLEAVSLTMRGQDVPWMLWIRLELLAQPQDVCVDGARRRESIIPPDLVEEAIA